MSNALFGLLDPEAVAAARRAERTYRNALASLTTSLPGGGCPPIPLQLYHALPWFFQGLYPDASEGDLDTVAAAGLLYFQHVLILDRAVDGDHRPNAATLLAGATLHERALTLLFAVLPARTDAWRRLASYVAAYAFAVADEEARRRARRPPDADVYAETARGKSAVLKGSPLMGLAVVGREEEAGVLDDVLDPFAMAVQIRDDLKDWRRDVAQGRASAATAQALTRLGALAEWGRGESPDEDDLAHMLFHDGIAEEAVVEAAAQARLSRDTAAAAGIPRWARLAGLVADQLDALAQGFADVRQRARRVRAVGATEADLTRASTRAAARLEIEHRRGYAEGRHHMRFPRSEGFTGSEEQEGEVFVRAVVGWVLGEARAGGVAVDDASMRENLDRLLALRLRGQRGGWSYFPDLPELPPDADDLAQVLLAFIAAGTEPPPEAFEEPVALALESAAGRDGAVSTWLVDPALRLGERRRYHSAIAHRWGGGADPEVVANLMYALHRQEPGRYAAAVAAGSKWIAARQAGDGSWASTWYEGSFYGTYVCARLLRAMEMWSPLTQAGRFLLAARHADGAWGLGRRSDPLSTALALCGLDVCRDVLPDGTLPVALDDGVAFLLLSQRVGGGWGPEPLVRMDVHRARHGTPRWLHHGSSTLTTAYALLALERVRAARALVVS